MCYIKLVFAGALIKSVSSVEDDKGDEFEEKMSIRGDARYSTHLFYYL